MGAGERDEIDKAAAPFEREAKRGGERSEELQERIDGVRQDWERRRADESVPGAPPAPPAPDENSDDA
jgi:hypothetical protein